MKISILNDYHDTLRTLDCFAKLSGRRRSLGTRSGSRAEMQPTVAFA